MARPMSRAALVFAVFLGALGCNPATTSSPSTPTMTTQAKHFTFRVDRTLDRSSGKAPSDELTASSYKPEAPADRWEITIEETDGGSERARVIVSKIPASNEQMERFEGKEMTPSQRPKAAAASERWFDIDKGMFAGGRFVMRGDEGELTTYGSGVPIVRSERGTLIAK